MRLFADEAKILRLPAARQIQGHPQLANTPQTARLYMGWVPNHKGRHAKQLDPKKEGDLILG